MKFSIATNLIVLLGLAGLNFIATAPSTSNSHVSLSKVFNYSGPMPIRDDRTGEVIKDNSTETEDNEPSKDELAEAEAACWKLIVEQSAVTFALQTKVLDELESDMKALNMDDKLRDSVRLLVERMRKNFADAMDALNRESAEEYFDSFFDASEDIIQMSSLIRDPKIEDTVFLTLVKAVSRLGRNNSALIQEFTDVCTIVQRSARPRVATPATN